jgi:hypothetical protein
MLPVNVLSFANSPEAPPAAFKQRARTYYNALVAGFTCCELEEYHARLAVQIFNFGGSSPNAEGPGSINDPSINTPTEFWALGHDGMQEQSLGMPTYVNPWMRQRLMGNGDPNAPWSLRGARPWMQAALTEWITGSDAMPAPRGGMYFDTEITMGGDELPWVNWTRSLQSDVRWFAKVPDVTPEVPGSTSLDTAWSAAAQAFGWPSLPATPVNPIAQPQLGIDPGSQMQRVRNREYGAWFGLMAERAITGALWYAAYDPIWSHDWGFGTLPDLPIANYGDFLAANRANIGDERFGWHKRRAEAFGPVAPSRDGWFGAIEGNFDQSVPSGPFYCDECKKYPYTIRAGSAGGMGNGTAVAVWKQDHNRTTTANLHAPVFYPVPYDAINPIISHHQENLYVPLTHPDRVEDQADATLREARFTLDSMNFSGVQGSQMAPWIMPPSDQVGIGVFGRTYYVDRDLFRRMLLLMRAKEVHRIQIFNMDMSTPSWRNCAREVYGVHYMSAEAKLGTELSGGLPQVTNTTPLMPGGMVDTFDIKSEAGFDFGKTATALAVSFSGLPQIVSNQGLRLVFECDVRNLGDESSTLPTPSADLDQCSSKLVGKVLMYNWGTIYSAPGWVKIELSELEGYSYKFPKCFDNRLDLSIRREITIDHNPEFQLVNSSGEARVLLVHANQSSTPFVSRWDLVQLAGYSSVQFCPSIGSASGPVDQPIGEATVGALAGADINFDGSINAADLGDFSSAFADAAPLADYNGDEQVTADDAVIFLTDFVEQVE